MCYVYAYSASVLTSLSKLEHYPSRIRRFDGTSVLRLSERHLQSTIGGSSLFKRIGSRLSNEELPGKRTAGSCNSFCNENRWVFFDSGASSIHFPPSLVTDNIHEAPLELGRPGLFVASSERFSRVEGRQRPRYQLGSNLEPKIRHRSRKYSSALPVTLRSTKLPSVSRTACMGLPDLDWCKRWCE